jgi:hypothetical protein
MCSLSEKEYENIILKNDKFTEDTMIALGLVKKYILNNKLIIVGGMAIDLSLRLKGSNLYEDDVLPDYDFYSPHHHVDAYHIAEKLHDAGLKNVSVINANHVSTMRVRVNYTVVADVTYMPPNIYKDLPTLIYRDMRIIHPHYQMIDQHRALSLPYENPPWEVITHRWKKDAARHDILYKYYPLVDDETDSAESAIALSEDEIKISSILFKDQCLGGFVALLYWKKQAEKCGFKTNKTVGTIEIDSGGMVVKIPVDSHGVSVYSNDILAFDKNIKSEQSIKKERMYDRFLDKLPFKIILDNKWELFDNKGCMMSAHKMDGSQSQMSNSIYIANLQNVMLYMLTNYVLLNKIKGIDRGRSFYVGYLLARELVQWAGCQYNKKPLKKFKDFLPSAEIYGTEEVSDSYLNSKRIFLEKIKQDESGTQQQTKEHLQPMLIFPETFVDGKIPQKYFKFNPRKSILLQFDGGEVNEYQDRF